MHGIKITVEGCAKGPIVINVPPSEQCTSTTACDLEEPMMQILSALRSLLRVTRKIETEQQRQGQQLIVQGRRQAEILRIVRRIEHPPQQPHVPTTAIVTFGPPVAE